jgi:hypothetical protein
MLLQLVVPSKGMMRCHNILHLIKLSKGMMRYHNVLQLLVPSKWLVTCQSLLNRHSRYVNEDCLPKKKMRAQLNGKSERSIPNI